MSVTKEYLRGIFNWTIPDLNLYEETGEIEAPHFTWAISPDGKQPIGEKVNTSPLVKGKAATNQIRVRGMLFTVEQIKKIFEI